MSIYRWFFRPLLYRLPAEQAHAWTLAITGALCRIPGLRKILRRLIGGSDRHLATTCFGLNFPNPIGLAAGMDKNGRYLWLWWVLGFGFVEIGTVTPNRQAGNMSPRLFRLPKHHSLINRMGFNNLGRQALKKRLKRRPPNILIGINIGKQKETPLSEATQDYLSCLEHLYSTGDYFVINVSSPNTQNLRKLQNPALLKQLLQPLQAFISTQPQKKPLLLKISPDLDQIELKNILTICQEIGIAALIATNTTTTRPDTLKSDEITLLGGISGALLQPLAIKSLHFLSTQTNPLPIISVGGILNPKEALQRRLAGASLLQLYTGLVYEGFRLPSKIKTLFRAEKA